MAEALFYLLSVGALVFAVGVIAARMPIYSVLSLLGAFFCVAGIYLVTGFQFFAATQLLVYAGAIMVLFLFVIMLLNLHDEELIEDLHSMSKLSPRVLAIAGGTAGALLLCLIYASQPATRPGSPELAAARIDEGLDQLHPLAEVLFSRYALPFEAASLLLLATMIGVIMLAKRERPGDAGGAAARGEVPNTYPWTATDETTVQENPAPKVATGSPATKEFVGVGGNSQ